MFGTILASLRDLFPAMPASVIVRQEARWVGQSFWGWLWLDAFGVGLGTGYGRGEKIQGGKAATEAGCGFEEAACGLSPCHFCHLPFPPNMGEERWRDARKKKYVSGQTYLTSLFSTILISSRSFYPQTPSEPLLLRVLSVRKTGIEVVVARKQAAFPVPLPIAPRLHTTSTYFHILPIARLHTIPTYFLFGIFRRKYTISGLAPHQSHPTYFLTAKKPAVHLTVIGIKRDSESVHTRTEGEMAHIVPSSSHQSAYTSPKPVIHIQYPSTS